MKHVLPLATIAGTALLAFLAGSMALRAQNVEADFYRERNERIQRTQMESDLREARIQANAAQAMAADAQAMATKALDQTIAVPGESAIQAAARHRAAYAQVEAAHKVKFAKEHPFAPSGWEPEIPTQEYNDAARKSDEQALAKAQADAQAQVAALSARIAVLERELAKRRQPESNTPPTNETEAVNKYRKAAEQGDVQAQAFLGVAYATGNGVPKASTEAVKWYRRAAEQGHAAAQCNLGVAYANGTGVLKDSIEAVKWYRKAAYQGDALAQCALGWMYAPGDGVPKDEIEGLAWVNIAAASGDKEFVKVRDKTELSVGRQAALAAQQRSKEILREIETARRAPAH